MQNDIIMYRKLLNPPLGQRSYFSFEEDFIEDNIRCIPMIVRFKMDAACIKLKLAEWCKFSVEERLQLALMPAATIADIKIYHDYLAALVKNYTGNNASFLPKDIEPAWADASAVPAILVEKAKDCSTRLTVAKWRNLFDLQRFALLKLCSSDHENKNLPKALAEFGLMEN